MHTAQRDRMTTAEPTSSPRQDRRKARTRARILDAAEEFFASADPESATIVRIAEAADVAIATVYQHFRSIPDCFDDPRQDIKCRRCIVVVPSTVVRNDHTRATVFTRADCVPGSHDPLHQYGQWRNRPDGLEVSDPACLLRRRR